MTGRDLVDALCRNVVGKPAAVCAWQDVLIVRDVVDELLNGAINRLQNVASTSPPAGMAMARQEPGNEGERAGTPFPAATSPAPLPTVRRHARGRMTPDGHTPPDSRERGTTAWTHMPPGDPTPSPSPNYLLASLDLRLYGSGRTAQCARPPLPGLPHPHPSPLLACESELPVGGSSAFLGSRD